MKKFLLTAVLLLIATYVFAQERIAVFPFEDRENVLTHNQKFMLYDEFSNEFATRNAGRFSVIPRQDVDRLINTEMDFQLSVFSAQEKTAEMMRVHNATQILSGTIGRLNNNIRITVSLFTYPDLVRLPGGTTLSVANTDELFSKIPELVRNMQNAIANTTVEHVPEGLEYRVDEGRAIITEYTGNATTLNIPAQIDGLSVTSIGEGAFSGCESLTSVTIPPSVTSIGERAFSGCTRLTSVTIPPSVTSIGVCAFAHCSSLTSLNIPSSVTHIRFEDWMGFRNDAFEGCSSLTNITVDSRNPAYTSIDGILFDKNLQTIIKYPVGKTARTYSIPSSVTSISLYAFAGCISLTGVTIPSSVKTIENSAFAGCERLTSVTIPSSVTSIEGNAFAGCINLTSVTIPSSVTEIGFSTGPMGHPYYAFSFGGCSRLTNITVDSRNTAYASIDGVLFDKNIQTIIAYPEGKTARTYAIPSSVTSIGNDAFGGSSLTSVTIPSSVTSIGDFAFSDCSSLTSVTIPSSVTEIGGSAFAGCSSLTSVTIPSSVTSISNSAFSGCSHLTNITVDSRNPAYASIDGVLFDKNIQTIISYPAGKTARTYTIPSSVTSIGDYAFGGCSSLTSVSISSSVTVIGWGAFADCSSLTSVSIPSSVTSIGEGAFEGCSSLTSVTLSRRHPEVWREVFPPSARITYRD